jgi:phosphate transport system permease protein
LFLRITFYELLITEYWILITESAHQCSEEIAINNSNQNPRSFRRLVDLIAGVCVRAGGMTIIVNIFLIFVLIVLATLPLWRSAQVVVRNQYAASAVIGDSSSGKIVAIGCDEQRKVGHLLTEDGSIHFFDMDRGVEISRTAMPGLSPARISSVWQSLNGSGIGVGTSDGRVLIWANDFFQHDRPTLDSYAPVINLTKSFVLDPRGQPIRCLTLAGNAEGRMFVAGITADDRILTLMQRPRAASIHDREKTITRQQLPRPESRPSQVAVNDAFEDFFIATDNGSLFHYYFSSPTELSFDEFVKAGERGITTLGFLIGGRSLVAGDGNGFTSVYFSVPDAETKLGRRFRRIHQLPSVGGSVVVQAASARNRTYLAAGAGGELGLFFSTNERVLFHDRLTEAQVIAAVFAPKADGLLLLDANQTVYDVTLHNPHPEANWKAFFGKIWYEGHEHPEHLWQSSGGSDDYEVKLSLVPLIYGTIKGIFYAMLLALPLALGTALHISHFMDPRLRHLIKPAIEMMATLPSVVLGFLAALWLAPLLEKIFPSVLLMIGMLPSMVVLLAGLWILAGRFMPRLRWVAGKETLFILPLLAATMWLCLQFNGALQERLFAGDFKRWLFETAGIAYDQRNAFGVGIAMAFAVVPVIFGIAEEALSNVPARLTAASLALGATTWQTAVRIILPTASSGILAAIMIGFGRAAGETMIVLMATGNTPIIDFSIFNGFRTLSANIAVEMPEAPVGGTLFRALFLAALLLFLLTFLTNTIAETVRQRMREKYARL